MKSAKRTGAIICVILFCCIYTAGCTSEPSHYDREVWLYSINPSGELNWDRCIDCTSMDTANSLLEDKNGNYVIGGSGVSKEFPDALIPEIVWISPEGELIEKEYYGIKSDGWITTLSNDSKGTIFAVCYSGKSLILDEKGALIHIIPVNVTGPGWWVSLNTPEGYAAAGMTEVFAVSDNGTLIWHTLFQDNETAAIRPSFIMNDEENYIVKSSYTYENENYVLLAELDNEGRIVNKSISLNTDESNKNNGYYCKSKRCYAESVTGSDSLFGRENNQIRLFAKDSAGDIIFDKYYNAGNFYDSINEVIETSDGGYAILVGHETYE